MADSDQLNVGEGQLEEELSQKTNGSNLNKPFRNVDQTENEDQTDNKEHSLAQQKRGSNGELSGEIVEEQDNKRVGNDHLTNSGNPNADDVIELKQEQQDKIKDEQTKKEPEQAREPELDGQQEKDGEQSPLVIPHLEKSPTEPIKREEAEGDKEHEVVDKMDNGGSGEQPSQINPEQDEELGAGAGTKEDEQQVTVTDKEEKLLGNDHQEQASKEQEQEEEEKQTSQQQQLQQDKSTSTAKQDIADPQTLCQTETSEATPDDDQTGTPDNGNIHADLNDDWSVFSEEEIPPKDDETSTERSFVAPNSELQAKIDTSPGTQPVGEPSENAVKDDTSKEGSISQEEKTKPETISTKIDVITKKTRKTILLLGESGSGKSTFINCFPNYIQYQNYDEIDVHKAYVLIPSVVIIRDEDYNDISTTYVGPEMTEAEIKNENHQEGQSSTQKAKKHTFLLGDNYELTFIDTPGLGDTRGVEQDKKNFQLTMDAFSPSEEIDAICILVHPNYRNLNHGLTTVLSLVMERFKSIAPTNIFFCFTRVRGTSYQPGDTLSGLRDFMKSQEYDVPLNRRNCFTFDNEGFSNLLRQRIGNNEYSIDKKSWEHSVAESLRLLKIIDDTIPFGLETPLLLHSIYPKLTEIYQKLGSSDSLKSKPKKNASNAEKEFYELRESLSFVTYFPLYLRTFSQSKKQDDVVLDKTIVNCKINKIYEEIEKNKEENHKQALEENERKHKKELGLKDEEIRRIQREKDTADSKLLEATRQLQKETGEVNKLKAELKTRQEKSLLVNQLKSENTALKHKLDENEKNFKTACEVYLNEIQKLRDQLANQSENGIEAKEEEAITQQPQTSIETQKRTIPADAKIHDVHEDLKSKVKHIRGYLSRPMKSNPDNEILKLLKEMKEQFKRQNYSQGFNNLKIRIQVHHEKVWNKLTKSTEECFTVCRNKELELTSFVRSEKKGNKSNDLLVEIVKNSGCECLNYPIPSKLAEDVLATCLLLNNLYKSCCSS